MNNKVNYVVIFSIVAFVVYLFMQNNRSVGNFTHGPPKNRFKDVVDEFGPPDMVINSSGGLAIWKNRDYFKEIILKDESIEHLKPKPHCDFLYATINVFVPESVKCILLELSQSIYYDDLKRELTARCHFMGANVATLYLAMMIINDPANAEMYKSKYGETIMGSMNPKTYKKLYNDLGNMVRMNQLMYKAYMPNVNCEH